MTALTPFATTDAGVSLFVWLARIFLLVVAVLLVAVLAWLFWLFPLRVAKEALRARRLGDWWAPFTPREDGRYGPLAENRWWSVFRAPERRESSDLAWRWAAWAFVAVALTLGVLRGLQQAVLLVAGGWS